MTLLNELLCLSEKQAMGLFTDRIPKPCPQNGITCVPRYGHSYYDYDRAFLLKKSGHAHAHV